MTFSSLGLSAELVRAVTDQGYATPTPVQSQAIPTILEGRDLMVSAQTGTGKTAAFTLPLLQRLTNGGRSSPRQVRALVLTPTRELAAQVGESVRCYGRHLPLRVSEVYGGVNINPQIKRFREGVDVLIATPGRLQDHLTRGTVSLSSVEVLVLDEADRMLDMGFLPAIESILRRLPAPRQTLLFSATFTDPIRKLAQRLLRSPQVIDVARRNSAAQGVTQSAYLVEAGRKRELLSYLIGSQQWQQVLVFTRTKRGADRLARQLGKDGIEAVAIHGDKSQGARTRALAAFKRRKVRVLVATDVASRGLDIDQLPHVVNFELPHNPEDYVHRIGRTGRGGQTGAALSLICPEERGQLSTIRKLIRADIPASIMTGFEPRHATVHPRSARKRTAGQRSGRPQTERSRAAPGRRPPRRHGVAAS